MLLHSWLSNYALVLSWDTHGQSKWGWMVGLGMPAACRLSSIWAGRCAEKKMTTKRARSPSGDQFMVLGLSLPVKKQISWSVFERLSSEKHQQHTFSVRLALFHHPFLPIILSFFLSIHIRTFREAKVRYAMKCVHMQLYLWHTTTRMK